MSQSPQFPLSRTRFAFNASVEMVPVGREGQLYMWTFTFVEALDVKEARRRWSVFLAHFNQWRRRNGVEFQGLRVFELHPGGHGLHIHVLTNCYWRVTDVRALWQQESIGGGRVHVVPIAAERAKYAGKYLRKAGRPECFHGVRLWAAFGGFNYCRCKDVEIDSPWTRAFAALRLTLGEGLARLRWWEKQQAVTNVLWDRPWWFGLVSYSGSG